MIIIFFGLFYFFLIAFFSVGIFRLNKPAENGFQPISVIIAARNEEKHLPNLLEILLSQNYPENRFEVIVANDRSNDKTAEIIANYQKKFSHLRSVEIKKESAELVGKKNALNAAIGEAKFEILAFTDADCLPTQNWLREIDRHFSEDIDFVAGYSPLIIRRKFLSILKNLERASHFAVTAGSLGWNWKITCSARNMAYRKSIFSKIDGFAGIGFIRSGDDDLMLQKMAKFIRKANFMFSPDSIVPSLDKDNISEMVQLESRRASKWRFYPLSVKLLSGFVFVYYLFLLLAVLEALVGALSWKIFFASLILKIFGEFLLLSIFLIKVRKIKLLWAFPVAEIIYVPYYIFFGLKGTFGKYKWKN